MRTDSGSSALKADAVGLSTSVATNVSSPILSVTVLPMELSRSARWAASGPGHVQASASATTSETTDA